LNIKLRKRAEGCKV